MRPKRRLRGIAPRAALVQQGLKLSCMLAVVGGLALAVTASFAQREDGEASQLKPTVFYCGPDYRPGDIAFSSDGTLYSSDTSRKALYRHDGDGCTYVGITSFAVTADPPNGICGVANDPSSTSTKPVVRSVYTDLPSYIFCFPVGAPEERTFITGPEATLGYFTRDVARVDQGYWVASWGEQSYSTVYPKGRLLLIAAGSASHDEDGGPVKRVSGTLLESLPTYPWISYFIAPLDGGDLLVTAWTAIRPVDSWFGNILEGAILHVVDGEVIILTKEISHPTGILVEGETIYVNDFLGNQIHAYTMEGKRLRSYSGVEGPKGLARAPNGDLCIAEALAARITCLPRAVIDGQPQ